MGESNYRNVMTKVLAGMVAGIVAYFSVVSTITISKVDALDCRFFARMEDINENKRNIAVLLEKIENIERMVHDIHCRLMD